MAGRQPFARSLLHALDARKPDGSAAGHGLMELTPPGMRETGADLSESPALRITRNLAESAGHPAPIRAPGGNLRLTPMAYLRRRPRHRHDFARFRLLRLFCQVFAV